MSYLVRKLTSRSNIDHIKECKNVDEVYSDVLKQEFNTKQNSLSMWLIENTDDFYRAALAIITTSSSIETMDFLIIEFDIFSEYDFNYENIPNETPYECYEDKHYDIKKLTFSGIKSLLHLYKNKKSITERMTTGKIKTLLKEEMNKGNINISKANESIKNKLISMV